MNLLERWIASLFIKRASLALASAVTTYWVAHQAPVLTHLAAAGVDVTVKIDAAKFADYLTVGGFAASQGLHEWLAVKYPELGKYL